MRIARYLLHRMAFILPQLLGIVLVSFLLVKSIPGDPAVLMLGPTATPDAIASLRTQMGFDQPLYVQFFLYVVHLLHGDLGTSIRTSRPVLEDLKAFFPATLELAVAALLLSVLVGVPLGVLSAVYHNRAIDQIARTLAVTGISTPASNHRAPSPGST